MLAAPSRRRAVQLLRVQRVGRRTPRGRPANTHLSTSAQTAESRDDLRSLLSIDRRDEPPAMAQLSSLRPRAEEALAPGIVSLGREDEPPASSQLHAHLPTEMSLFAGARSAFTPHADFWYPEHGLPPAVPCFRVVDDEGRVVPGAAPAAQRVAKPLALAIYKQMIRTQV